jgi:hypothetical protein
MELPSNVSPFHQPIELLGADDGKWVLILTIFAPRSKQKEAKRELANA